MVRLLVYTDDPLHSIALEHLLRECEDVFLVSVVSDVTGLQQKAGVQPEVILLAVDQGIDWGVLNALRHDFPKAKIVLWVHDITHELAFQAMEGGIRGILRRNLQPEMILKCIRKVSEGELWFEKGLTQAFLNGRSVKISPRQRQLITLVSQGLKNKEIASELSITEGTVKVYLSRLFEKLGAKDRLELALLGLRNAQALAAGQGERFEAALPASMFIDPLKTTEAARKSTPSRNGPFLLARSAGR